MPSPRRHLSMDELSHRASTGLAIRRGDVKISDPIPSSYVHNGPEMDYDAAVDQSAERVEGTWPRRSATGTLHGRSDSRTQHAHISRFTERTSTGPSLSVNNTMPPTVSRNVSMQRSGSGFRATLKRMFSKKDRSTTLQKKALYYVPHNQDKPLNSSAGRLGHLDRPLLASHNISRSDALHSHAVSPLLDTSSEFSANQEPSSRQLGVRRNTVPSLSLLQEYTDTTVPTADIQTVSQRPRTATRHPSPPQPQFKRRSRSADTLADLLRSPKSSTIYRHDRAEEIAYWRSSVLENPIPRSAGRAGIASITTSEPTERPDTSPARPPRPSIEPVQDFDFGLNEGTEAARSTTLQERVNTLEVKLFDFEYALAKLQGNNIAKPDLPQRISTRRSMRELSTPDNILLATESSSNTDSPQPSQRDYFVPPASSREQRADRASKATTIRPTHRRTTSQRSQASPPRSVYITSEQHDMLYHLIREERVARQQLENQILNLQKEVDTLRSPVYTYIGPDKYPTPSPDSLRNQPVMPTRPRVLHSPRLRTNYNVNEASRFSATETESDTDADADEVVSPEVYETPQEKTFRFDSRPFNTLHNMI